jgi:hypothetical protein
MDAPASPAHPFVASVWQTERWSLFSLQRCPARRRPPCPTRRALGFVIVYFRRMSRAISPGSIAILVGFLLLSCTSKDDLMVWKAEFPSPDSEYIATAETIQNGGFGSAGISTSVYIAQAGHSDKKTEILGFACDGPIAHPYTLDNVANAGGSINLKLKWIDTSHLHVTYQGNPAVYFQAVKFGHVVITLEDLARTLSIMPLRSK